ncbi:MAG: polysaccharide lyase family protein [Planctomycetota bacterium]|nr:polysaccharide lyase family protein [Planctomycetota bacterium]
MSRFLPPTFLAAVCFALLSAAVFAVDDAAPLWEIGKADNDTREFALAPGGYADYSADGFFIVGESNPARDWPYVHPGPTDPWAGTQPHTFTIAFALDTAPAGDAALNVALVDTQAKAPPRLTIRVNGKAGDHQMPAGAGDASVFGQPDKGKPHRFDVPIAAGTLKAGVNTIEITSTEGSWVLYDALSLRAPGAKLGKVPEGAVKRPPRPKGVEQVIIAFKTHFDIGYTALAREVVQRYRTGMIDQALQVVDKNKNLPPEQQFVWTIPGWPMHKMLEDYDTQDLKRKPRIRQALKDGRFVVHALPFTTHTETLEAEDLVRGLGFSSRICRELNLELPRDAKMTDVASHCWIVPMLLRNAGVDFLHLGCNAACKSPKVPSLFLWESPDGSRLLTMYTAEGYGTGLVPPKGWPYKTWLALTHTGDNHGPPTPDEVKKLLDEAARRLPGVKVRIGRLSDFGDAILAEKPDLPIVRGDMPDTWIHGLMSDPAGASIARNVRPQIAVAEALHTQLGLWGVQVQDAAPALAAAYENSLLYGEHTWGGAQYWITQYGKGTKFGYGDVWKAEREKGRFKRLEESWAEHTSYIEQARNLVSLEPADALAQSVKADGPRVVVYNPLPWKRSGVVELHTRGMFGALKAVDSDYVAHVEDRSPKSGSRSARNSLRFVARDVPPMGYMTYVPVKAEPPAPRVTADAVAATIESPAFKAVLDPARCAVKSLVDKRSGRELVDANAPYGFGQYLCERFDVENTKAFLKAYVKSRPTGRRTKSASRTCRRKSRRPTRLRRQRTAR